MIIVGSAIRSLDRYIDASNYGNLFIFGAQLDSIIDPILARIGFALEPSIGDRYL